MNRQYQRSPGGGRGETELQLITEKRGGKKNEDESIKRDALDRQADSGKAMPSLFRRHLFADGSATAMDTHIHPASSLANLHRVLIGHMVAYRSQNLLHAFTLRHTHIHTHTLDSLHTKAFKSSMEMKRCSS